MIITLFVIFLILSIILIFLGKYVEAPPVSLAGFLFLFIIGVAIIISGLGYEAGTSYNYVCSCCENGIYTEGYTIGLGFCYGTPNPCDHYDLNELDCIASGCTYNSTDLNCYGTPSDCDTFNETRTCELVDCYWDIEQGTEGCSDGSTLTLKNTTRIYSDYSGEAGITITRTIGFFISIIGVLGWIIILINLKSGKESYGTWNKGGNREE